MKLIMIVFCIIFNSVMNGMYDAEKYAQRKQLLDNVRKKKQELEKKLNDPRQLMDSACEALESGEYELAYSNIQLLRIRVYQSAGCYLNREHVIKIQDHIEKQLTPLLTTLRFHLTSGQQESLLANQIAQLEAIDHAVLCPHWFARWDNTYRLFPNQSCIAQEQWSSVQWNILQQFKTPHDQNLEAW